MFYVFLLIFFFFNDTATTEIYTLSLHDALPISNGAACIKCRGRRRMTMPGVSRGGCSTTTKHATSSRRTRPTRSEEHTSELQSRQYLVCRLLLEKKKKNNQKITHHKLPVNIISP